MPQNTVMNGRARIRPEAVRPKVILTTLAYCFSLIQVQGPAELNDYGQVVLYLGP